MIKSKHNDKVIYIKTLSHCKTYALVTRDEKSQTGLYKVDLKDLPEKDVKKLLK